MLSTAQFDKTGKRLLTVHLTVERAGDRQGGYTLLKKLTDASLTVSLKASEDNKGVCVPIKAQVSQGQRSGAP